MCNTSAIFALRILILCTKGGVSNISVCLLHLAQLSHPAIFSLIQSFPKIPVFFWFVCLLVDFCQLTFAVNAVTTYLFNSLVPFVC